VTILYCAWSLVAQKLLKQDGMLAFFFLSFLSSSAIRRSKNQKKVTKNLPKLVKMEAWSGSGDSWGSAWRHFGPKKAQSSKKVEKQLKK